MQVVSHRPSQQSVILLLGQFLAQHPFFLQMKHASLRGRDLFPWWSSASTTSAPGHTLEHSHHRNFFFFLSPFFPLLVFLQQSLSINCISESFLTFHYLTIHLCWVGCVSSIVVNEETFCNHNFNNRQLDFTMDVTLDVRSRRNDARWYLWLDLSAQQSVWSLPV